MNKILRLFGFLILFNASLSCTKELDEDIFSFDVDELEALEPEIDPETGLPVVEIDPETGLPVVEIDPETGLPIELDPVTGEPIDPEDLDDPEEIDPNLSSDNAVSGFTILIDGLVIQPVTEVSGDNVVELVLSLIHI